jgi:hypothetical protein
MTRSAELIADKGYDSQPGVNGCCHLAASQAQNPVGHLQQRNIIERMF